MKTLLIYYSQDEQIRELCEQARCDGTSIFEICEYFDRSDTYVATIGSYLALLGKNTAIEKEKPDLSLYDTIIIACPVWALNPPPAVNAFLRSTNLKGKEVIGLLFRGGVSGAVARCFEKKNISCRRSLQRSRQPSEKRAA